VKREYGEYAAELRRYRRNAFRKSEYSASGRRGDDGVLKCYGFLPRGLTVLAREWSDTFFLPGEGAFMMRFSFLVLLVSAVSFADFSGEWKGEGKAWDSDGFKTECSEVKVVVEQSAKTFSLKEISWTCIEAANTWEEMAFEIKEGKLVSETKELGELSGNLFKVLTQDLEMPFLFQGTLNDDGKLLYHEEWRGQNGYTYFVEGTLAR